MTALENRHSILSELQSFAQGPHGLTSEDIVRVIKRSKTLEPGSIEDEAETPRKKPVAEARPFPSSSKGAIANAIAASSNIAVQVGQARAVVNSNVKAPTRRKTPKDEFLHWLSPINYQSTQEELCRQLTPGTGEWFHKTKVYKRWRKKRTKICGIGLPGAGKTLLSALVIDKLRTRYATKRDVAVLFIYGFYKDNYPATQLLGTLLRQLAERSPSMKDHIRQNFYQHHIHDRTVPTEDNFAQMLKESLTKFRKVFIVVDGLDELKEKIRSSLLRILLSLDAAVLLTSRPSNELERLVPKAYHFSIRAPPEDFKQVILSEASKHPGLAFLLQPEMKEQALETIIKKSDGILLLASLQLNNLESDRTSPAQRLPLIQSLESLPVDLKSMYTLMLDRIQALSRDQSTFALRALLWAKQAVGRIPADALCEAAATQPQNDGTGAPKHALTVSTLLAYCHGLLVFDNENESIGLIHHSFQEFLDECGLPMFANPHGTIASECIRYLRHSGLLACHELKQFQRAMQEQALLTYAYDNWDHHVRSCDQYPELPADIHEFIAQNPYFPYPAYFQGRNDLDILSPIHTASLYGLPIIVKELAPSSHECLSKAGLTALHMACNRDESLQFGTDIVKLLLGQMDRTLINSRDSQGFTALHYAASKGSPSIIRLLLDQDDINVNAKDNDGFSPLLCSLRNAHRNASPESKEAFALLLQHPEIDVNLRPVTGGPTPLIIAASLGADDLVRMLLERGADLNAKDSARNSALDSAISGKRLRYQAVAEFLVSKGAKPRLGTVIPAKQPSKKSSLWKSLKGRK